MIVVDQPVIRSQLNVRWQPIATIPVNRTIYERFDLSEPWTGMARVICVHGAAAQC
jgi:hypothetical protein